MDQWQTLISELEDSLEYVQCALETGIWDESESPTTSQRPNSLPEPTHAQRTQVLALLEEVSSTEAELASKMNQTQTELAQTPKKLKAARRYSGTVALASR